MFDLLSINDFAVKKEPCKGRFYKGVINTFINSKGHIIEKKSLIPLKKLSCKGCEECGYLNEYLQEDISCNTFPPLDRIEHGKIYKIYVHGWQCYEGDWDSEWVIQEVK